MSRIIILIVLSIFLITCAAEKKTTNQKSIKVSSGKTIEVLFEKYSSPETGTIFLVECSTVEKIIKEETVEKDILEIWSEIEKFANETELSEAIIKYEFAVETVNENGESEKNSTLALFRAEKLENGKWKIDKNG